jgi:hypothetical protein
MTMASEPLQFLITADAVKSLPDSSADVVESVKPEMIERADGAVSAAPAPRWMPGKFTGVRNV